MNINNQSQVSFGIRVAPELREQLIDSIKKPQPKKLVKAINQKIDEIDKIGVDTFELAIGEVPQRDKQGFFLRNIKRPDKDFFIGKKAKGNFLSAFLALQKEDLLHAEDAVAKLSGGRYVV